MTATLNAVKGRFTMSGNKHTISKAAAHDPVAVMSHYLSGISACCCVGIACGLESRFTTLRLADVSSRRTERCNAQKPTATLFCNWLQKRVARLEPPLYFIRWLLSFTHAS